MKLYAENTVDSTDGNVLERELRIHVLFSTNYGRIDFLNSNFN